jgi:hypothetical protein
MQRIIESAVEASSILKGLGRKLSRVQDPAPEIPATSAVEGTVSRYAEITRAKRNVVFEDGGNGASIARFESEKYPIPAPCDMRDITHIFGESSRLIGRSPIMRHTST